jgi:glycine cleavage system H protein
MSHQAFLYTESHEWIEAQGDIRKVGITDHAQHLLGDIVFIELPEVGRIVEKGEELITIESPKAAADVYAPVSGEIVEVNSVLDAEPNTVNQAPYEAGWLVKIKVSNPGETSEMLSYADYQKIVEG